MKSENALIFDYGVNDCYGEKYVTLFLNTPRGDLDVSFPFSRLSQLLDLLSKEYIDDLINCPIIIQSVPLGCTVRWIDNFLGFLTNNSFKVNEEIDCKICSYQSSDYINYCNAINKRCEKENESN